MAERFILLTGCSGGGKSTLLSALAARGCATVPEPGRRIIAEQVAGGGKALPWVDMEAFARRAIEVARSDLAAAQKLEGPVFFDRGLIDAAVALEHCGGRKARDTFGEVLPYARRVFVAPPWRALFVNDAERQHSFEAAVQEYMRIAWSLDELGYEQYVLPKMSVTARADIILKQCGL
ncbi:AAA family ATPase [Shimia sp. R9_2]|uniref:AAA family ATPase n=1 Tax=Shimia sp. R9_2 TaxID=2821112 RepID=UPI001ADAE68C|nr:AAA family ATPase [Shimia sp. R9_2]MBO9398940.1 AAA family ATPase [Shimia sp. R9_2]